MNTQAIFNPYLKFCIALYSCLCVIISSAQNNGWSSDIFQTNPDNIRPYKEWLDIMSDQNF